MRFTTTKTDGSTTTVAVLLALTLFLPDSVLTEDHNRVVCYYTNWSVYRPGTAKFSPQNINPYLCTHLIYAFGGFTKENSLKPFDKYQDIEKGGYAKFTGLKTYNKNLKTLLAIGGWNEGSSRFSPMVASPERRKEMIKNAIKFLRQNHFDGLDLDWEYPAFRDGGKSRDRDNYAQLVQELREEFDRESQKTGRPRLLLTMAVPAGLEYIDKGYDIPKLNKYLDWMNILSYDYHSAFEPSVNHHSPLYSLTDTEDDEYNFDEDLNIDATIKHYLKSGADREKLVVGIPTYGRSYTLFNPDANEIGAPADGPGEMGDATRENGYLAYYEICENLKNGGWKVVQPNPKAMGPYAYKGNQWVGFDDEQIVRKKSEYVAQMGLGGIMFWAIDNDDFRGTCSGKPYPLIEAAKEALLNAPSDNLVVLPKRKRPNKDSDNEISTRGSPVRNSGGPQGNIEEDTTKDNRGRKRVRIQSNKNNKVEQKSSKTRNRVSSRRRTRPITEPTTVSTTSPQWNTRSTTPEPPTTPDPGSDFKCEDEGFFPHPRDCKKYFWCLSSGPSQLGIVAHQFTCPSGLYFNKAADSCDYTQNVLCNKKLKKSSTTSATTTTSSTTPSTTTTTEYVPQFSTRRVPPKITAATSRTTFLYTTTTTTKEPEFEDEYEYVDEDEEESTPDSEEDPRVIKELIELIRKAGGIEQLEKYLQVQDNGTTSAISGVTTPATISKSLYERVLSKTGSSNPHFQNPNSRPQYQTISRQRTQTTETEPQVSENPVDSSSKTILQRRPGSTFSRFRPQGTSRDEEEDYDGSTKRPGAPEYVTIRRNRPSTSTIESDGLEYVTIRRQNKPQEETTTSKYTTIIRRRPSTETNDNNESETEEPKQEDNLENQTTQQTIEEDLDNKKDSLGVVVQLPSQEGVIVTGVVDSTASPDFSSTISSTTERPSTPVLFKPRPFVARPRPTKLIPSSTTEQTSTTTRKVSQRINGATRGTSRFTSRRRPTTEAPLEYDEYDDANSDIGRTFRPAHLADLSSLTSADIQFGKGNGRRPSRRRPTSESTSTSTTEKILTSDLKTGSRTIPLARKTLPANLDTSKNTRRIVRPITKPPDQSIPVKVSTTYKIDTPKQYSTISRIKPSTINFELTTLADLEDSTGSDTDNSFKITEPETSTEEVFARTRKVIKRIRISSTSPSPVQDEGTIVGTNKAVVRRRPINREEPELNLSESTINDGTRIGINGLQTEKVIKRKKIIRKIRPVKKEEDRTEFGSKVEETTIDNGRSTRKRPRVFEEPNSSTERRPISRRPISRITTESIQESKVQIGARFADLESEKEVSERPKQRIRIIIRQRGPATTEVLEDVTSESNFIAEPAITTTSEEDVSTLSEENFTEDDLTTEYLTTTTTTSTTPKPRSTVASLTGRPRPAYRPRGRTPTTPDPLSTTTNPLQYRRRQRPQFNARTSTTGETSSTTLYTTSTTEVPITETEKDLMDVTTTEDLTTTPEDSISTVIDEMLKELTTILDEDQITTTEDRPTFITDAMIDTTPVETTQTDREQDTTISVETAEALSTSTTEKNIPVTTTQQSTTGISSTQEPRTTRLRIRTTTQAPTSEATERITTPRVLRRFKPGDRAKPKVNIPKPNETIEENKPKFVPARPADQRQRLILRRENKTQENEELKPTRKFIPQGRKLTLPKSAPENPDLDKEAEIETNEPNNEVQDNLSETKNTPFPGRGLSRNYTRKFSNKPIYTTTPSTTTVAIQPEILARNKQLFSNPRKMNVPVKPTTEETPSTEETSTEPQQLSTLIHVFAEIQHSGQETTQVPDMTTETNIDKNLERLVEVNRIVEVSVEEHLNNKTVPKIKVLNPQIAKVGQINRLTVINVVGGDNNNFATLDDILTGKKIFSSFPSNVSYVNVTEEISTVPNDQETNLNILNNTLEIIEANKKFEIFSRSNVVDYSPKKVDPIASAITKEGAPPIIESVLTSSSEKTETDAPITQTDSPTTEEVTQTSSEKANTLDDQDLIQSANKRVKIRILEPVYSPIVAESFQEIVTTKAKVVEVPQKNQDIRIAPIEVALT